MKTVAALDLGTNTFLCLIAEGDRLGIQKIHYDKAQVVRLGQEINKNKAFHPDALIRAEKCLREFKKIIDKYKVDQVLAMATSAARDAKNKEKFFEICTKIDIPVKIISGEDEARITFRGATAQLGSFQKENNCLVIDIGGGSTELIFGEGEKIVFAKSLNIGCVRLTEELIRQQPVSDDDQSRLFDRVENEMEKILKKKKDLSVQKIIAVAGTPTSLAAAMLGEFKPEKVDGFKLKISDLENWVKRLKATSVEEKISQFNIEPGRADVIYVGAVILWMVARQLGLPEIEVSIKGVRYGIALEMLES